jgi:hypothetical protein
MKALSIYVNDQLVYEYDRDTPLADNQLTFLDRMDADMERGIKIRGELIKDPDVRQRATFVAMNLIRALQQENDAAVSVSCAYLATRLPALAGVQAKDHENTVRVELVEQQE